MKWYKHISDSLDDPFIFDLMTEFKSDAYVVFFGVIEIYSREFLPENQWKLVVSLSYLHQKLRVSPSKVKKILSKIYKWNIDYNGNQVSIFIPKFTELLDEWTQRKLGSQSGVSPKILKTDKDKDTDKDKEEDIIPPLVADKSAPCPHEEIIALYHKTLPELPAVKIWTAKRQGYLRSRWKESTERQNLEWWEKYFAKIKKSPFLTGNVTDFKASLEWVVNQSNMVKILEGKYDGGNGNGGIRTNRSDPRDKTLQSREDAEVSAITAKWEASRAAKDAARRDTGGNAGNDDAPRFQGVGSG